MGVHFEVQATRGAKERLLCRSVHIQIGLTLNPVLSLQSSLPLPPSPLSLLGVAVRSSPQVKMVLIPKREEFSDAERIRLWWAREDYARFRQVLIDWKRANAHRISQSDNILSINLSDIDDDEEEAGSFGGQPEAVVAPVGGYNHDHDEAAAAADATAAAAAVAAAQAAAEAAKAMAAAAVTAQANAAATAAAAAAATAAEVAAMNAQEVERERQQAAATVAAAQQLRRQEETPVTPAPAAAALPQQQEDESTKQSAADAWEMEVAVAKEMAAAVAAAGGGISGGMAAHGYPADDDGELSDIPEGHEGQEDQDDARSSGRPAESASESSGANPSKAYTPRASFTMGCVPDWSSTGGANGTFPLRRALTFGETGSSPPSPGNAAGYGGRLKAVPLSEAQATAESLRAWRKNFDALYDLGGSSGGGGGGDGDGDGEEEEDRGRAMSLQQQTRNYAQRGRATALVMSRTKWASDVGGGGLPGSAAAAAAAAAGGAFGRPRQGEAGSGSNATGTTRAATAVTGGAASGGGGEKSGGCSVDLGVDEQQQQQQQAGEKQLRNLSDQDERSVFLASPVMAAFERERAQAAAREAELEEARVARATAMVKAAMAEKLTSASSTAKPASAAVAKAGGGGGGGGGGVGGSGDRCDGDSIVELGLNDAPGSAAAASAAGLRIATDGVSNLSLRSKDSVENLQELGEHSWGPLPLSSSA